VGVVLVHNKRAGPPGVFSGRRGAATNCRTHYWALRQQARHLFVLIVGNRGWL
jgi:hypothetical protein